MKTQNNSSSVLWAVVLIVLGSIFFFRNFDMLGFDLPVNFFSWKLVFVFIAVNEFFKGKIIGGVIWSLVSLFVFYPFLLNYISVNSILELWPLLLIAFGLNMIIGRNKALNEC